jgi:hypothetical protein
MTDAAFPHIDLLESPTLLGTTTPFAVVRHDEDGLTVLDRWANKDDAAHSLERHRADLSAENIARMERWNVTGTDQQERITGVFAPNKMRDPYGN